MKNLKPILVGAVIASFVTAERVRSNGLPEINPDLTAARARELLFESAYATADGGKIINPGKFVELIKSTKARKIE